MAEPGVTAGETAPAAAASLERFFQAVGAAFDEAAATTGVRENLFGIGGTALRLRCAGDPVQACMVRALAHLPPPAAPQPELEVSVWDSAGSGIALPTPPWPDHAQVSRGEIQGLAPAARFAVAFQPGSQQLALLDRDAARGLLWLPDAERCPPWDIAAPLRTLLHWWFTDQDLQLVHAAAVGDDDGALLLTGRGGSGKSTTALTALTAGMQYLGDDYVLCDLSTKPPRVHSLYNTAKVDRLGERRAALSAITAERGMPDQDKALIFTYPAYARQLPPQLPLRAIVVPQVTDRQTPELHRLGAPAALLALAPTTVFQLPGAGGRALGTLRGLVEALPCYSLALGADASPVPALLRELIRSSS